MEVQPPLTDFYWKGVTGRHQIGEELYAKCTTLIVTPQEFEEAQLVLKGVHDDIKSGGHAKGFHKYFEWQETNYTEAYLLEKKFRSISTSTIFAVPDGNGKYEIKFIYLRETPTSDPMLPFCDCVFKEGKARYRKLGGQSIVDERSNKTMTGVMLAYGSWDAYGNKSQGLGKKKMQVRVYGPSGKKDETAYKLMKAHVDDLTRAEETLAPACAAARAKIMDELDPYREHRMSEVCKGPSMTASSSFVTDPHDDSGMRGVLELIKFVNANGPLPEGHKWQFVIAGCILELPGIRGETVIVGLPAQGVYHGTLPTSSTKDTYPHGNYGSALITKASVVNGLTRQMQEGKSTPAKYCASNMYDVPKGKSEKWYEETRKVTESVSRRDGLVIKKRTMEARRRWCKQPVSSESSDEESDAYSVQDDSNDEDNSKAAAPKKQRVQRTCTKEINYCEEITEECAKQTAGSKKTVKMVNEVSSWSIIESD